MRLHILGICGTFMGGIAALAREAGHQVTGSDLNVYPPMSEQLKRLGIGLTSGYDASQLEQDFEQLIVGNALTRGLPVIEAMLNRGLNYCSGPEWLSKHILAGRTVIAVAGTHGKTTTAGMVAHILEQAGLQPGFLIGGVPGNFAFSARLGQGQCFVVEADEYDCAFFDKRAKFLHYRPRVAILNNLEYDHADIYPDIASIRRQFHHLIRTIPSEGRLIVNAADRELAATLAMGVYTPTLGFGAAGVAGAKLTMQAISADASAFSVWRDDKHQGDVRWSLFGEHNALNALAAMAACEAVGVELAQAMHSLSSFQNAKRRLEVRAHAHGVTVWDDFAHHPSAYRATLQALRQRVGATARVIAIVEPRSATQRRGVHQAELADALQLADRVLVLEPPQLTWSLTQALAPLGSRASVCTSLESIIEYLWAERQPSDHWLVMSNGGFGGLHERLITRLHNS
jgi:UDP-N-acetylmuramate: L-alanyl-gamma-D-glutamyl-meso-diaminopimelate ligase